MGNGILDLVLERLREAGFRADAAYPGQRYPALTGCVAAVHIEKADQTAMTVTVEVIIACPAAQGGTQCELEALRAAEVLRQAGACCVLNGCQYDGASRNYTASVQATFTGTADGERIIQGQDFSVYIAQTRMPYAVSFQAGQKRDNQARYAMGESAPIGISQGSWLWSLRLEELFDPGRAETVEDTEPFTLRITRGPVTETYHDCRWTAIQREFSREGLRRIRSGISMGREETVSE